ncbi:MAG: hypothetical protein FJ388_04680 [Verrucomicrobia bacterium]|nr:hypothetical protein [Verrucomicrobiota bacterium]
MGLTIHYTLSVKEDIALGVVRELTKRAAAYARKIGCEHVSELLRAEEHEKLSCVHPSRHFNDPPFSGVMPRCGWLVSVWPGPGCEIATFGLCRYPRWIPRGQSYVSAGFKKGWFFHSFCKTQYAGAHGWDHFAKCHLQVISLLDFWKRMGVRVKVEDEGGFWKNRSKEKLREELRQYDRLVAAMGGVFKDKCDQTGQWAVRSPIFDYPAFERLEHEGRQEYGGHIKWLRGKLRGLMRAASKRVELKS